MSRTTGLVLAVLVGVTLLPLAAADHAYSHRYVVYGRLLDADGNPVPGVTVNMGTKDFEYEGPCAQQPLTETEAFGRTETRPTTNQHGEFMFCFHAHEINRVAPPKGFLRIDEFNVDREFTFDPYTRMTFMPVQLDRVVDKANRTALDTSLTVLGRLWKPAGERILVDSVPVFGHTVDRTRVNITVKLDDGTTLNVNTTTNNYGDFAIRVPIEKRPSGGTVTIEAAGETFEEEIDTKYGVASIRAEYPQEGTTRARTGLYILLGLIGIGVLATGGWYGVKKLNERREGQAVRRTSSRKRSQR